MIEIENVMKALADKRKIFHSEADLQHALAWEIHKRWPSSSIRLEFKPAHLDNRIYLDIWATCQDSILAVEVKYKTRKFCVNIDGEEFNLRNQRAQNGARYDFLKDIERLEEVVSGRSNIVGYAIFLTNDYLYWKEPRRRDTLDAKLRIHEGKKVEGKLDWAKNTRKGTKGGREKAIDIKGSYTLRWKDYSEPKKCYGKFKYLFVEVSNKQKGRRGIVFCES